jgi:hypothetical protein
MDGGSDGPIEATQLPNDLGDDDLAAVKRKCQLVNTSIAADDWSILKLVGDNLSWRKALVHPLTRYGFSGARIYVVEPEHGTGGIPRVVKVSTVEEIQKEITGLTVSQDYIRRFPSWTAYGPGVGNLMAITFPLFTAAGAAGVSGEVTDAADVYSGCLSGGAESEHTLIPMLRQAIDLLAPAHVIDRRQRPETYGNLFGRYLRGNRMSRIDMVFAEGGIEICGHAVPSNPREALDDLLQQKSVGFRSASIHGDFHLSNIVADGAVQAPTLIDFAWAEKAGHILLDYVMLESSLRFMKFPRTLNPSIVLAVDRALNSSFSMDEGLALAATVRDETSRSRLKTMLQAVGVVRTKAYEVACRGPVSEARLTHEYFRALYILLSGQEKFDEYPLMRTAANLNQLQEVVAA